MYLILIANKNKNNWEFVSKSEVNYRKGSKVISDVKGTTARNAMKFPNSVNDSHDNNIDKEVGFGQTTDVQELLVRKGKVLRNASKPGVGVGTSFMYKFQVTKSNSRRRADGTFNKNDLKLLITFNDIH
jgi:hypothetical protein